MASSPNYKTDADPQTPGAETVGPRSKGARRAEGKQPATPEAELLRRQRRRSIAIALALAALAIIFYVMTIVRLGGNLANRPL